MEPGLFETLAATRRCSSALRRARPLVGSFLNVVIHRVPVMMDNELRAECAELARRADEPPAAAGERSAQPTLQPRRSPRSACPKCKAPITALQNIPVVSWLALRGKCASCKTPISERYPLVELATGVLSAFVAWHFGFGVAGARGAGVHLVPDRADDDRLRHAVPARPLTYPLLWLGLIVSLWHPVGRRRVPVAPRDSIIGAAAGYLSLWSVYWLFKLHHRQGRHGLRRLQAVRRARRLAGLEDAAAHHRVRLGRGRGGRHRGHDPRSAGAATRRSRSGRSSRSRAGSRWSSATTSSTDTLGLFATRVEHMAAPVSEWVSPAASPAARAPSPTCSRRSASPSSTPTCWRARWWRQARRCCRRSPRISGRRARSGRQPRPRARCASAYSRIPPNASGSRSSRIRPSAHSPTSAAIGRRAPTHRRHSAARRDQGAPALRSRAGRRLRARSCSSRGCRRATASRASRPRRCSPRRPRATQRLAVADDVIRNDGDIAHLRDQVESCTALLGAAAAQADRAAT